MPAARDAIFAGTADAYARFRPPYPLALWTSLLEEAHLGADSRLLDLGCGTGEVCRPLAPHFAEVIAVDVDPDMLRVARAKVASECVEGIRFVQGAAEDVGEELGRFDLVTLGASFHWMDRRIVGRTAFDLLRPGGHIAVLGGNSPWTSTADWQKVVVGALEKWLGQGRRAGRGRFDKPAQSHEEVLAALGFEAIQEQEFPTPHAWTVDSVLGYLASTSFASKAVLESRAGAFEQDLRARLLAGCPAGDLSEVIAYYYVLGRKPRE